MPGVTDSLWSAQDTTPGAIEAALRQMLRERHAEGPRYVPARALNLVCVVDRRWAGEIANRLRRVGRFHASRTIVCEIEPGRDRLDAVATIATDAHPQPGELVPLRETVIVEIGEQHVERLDSIVDPLVVSDLPTVVWAPHGHDDALAVLLGIARVVLTDSLDEPDLKLALARVAQMLEQAYVVDLAWLRSTPWRERVAAAFDAPQARAELDAIASVVVRHAALSSAAGLLLVGWLASRLGWEPSALAARDGGGLAGSARAGEREVALRLEVVEQDVRGLAGVTIETASGRMLELDRADGGLRAHARDADGAERRWTVLGASRGEGGILGEGIRQALLRDPTYGPALAAARALAPS